MVTFCATNMHLFSLAHRIHFADDVVHIVGRSTAIKSERARSRACDISMCLHLSLYAATQSPEPVSDNEDTRVWTLDESGEMT